jgi:hypothetical protein
MVLAAAALATMDGELSGRDRKTVLNHTVGVVAAELGNTPTVCRASYIHPTVVDAFVDGTLTERWSSASGRGSPLLSLDERKALHFLEAARTDSIGEGYPLNMADGVSRSHNERSRPVQVDCAWCQAVFDGVLELLTHVDQCLLPPAEAA